MSVIEIICKSEKFVLESSAFFAGVGMVVVIFYFYFQSSPTI